MYLSFITRICSFTEKGYNFQRAELASDSVPLHYESKLLIHFDF